MVLGRRFRKFDVYDQMPSKLISRMEMQVSFIKSPLTPFSKMYIENSHNYTSVGDLI